MNTKLTDLIYYQKAFLSKEECEFLIAESNRRYKEYAMEACPEASTGVQTQSTFQLVDLKIGSEAWKIVHTATEKMINQYHDYLDEFGAFHVNYRKMLNYSHLYRLLRYDVGAKIHPHVDYEPYVYASCSFNLNDDYTGGDFAWFRGKHKMKLGAGDAIIWPADYFWVHEVEPILSGTRYSTNSFIQELPECLKLELYKARTHLENNIPTIPSVIEQFRAKYQVSDSKGAN